MSITDETLMAYADGELAEPARSELERAVRADPALAARVAQHQALRADVFAAFAPIAEEPVPPALLAAALPEQVRDLGAARAARDEARAAQEAEAQARRGREAQQASRRRWAWPEWGAMAASLAAGVLVGSMVLGGGHEAGGGERVASAGSVAGTGADAAAAGGGAAAGAAGAGAGVGAGAAGPAGALVAAQGADGMPVAQGRLAEALSNQLAGGGQAGAGGGDGAVRIGVTFAATDGALCRSFIAGSAAGLACRSGEQWKVAVLAEAERGAGGDYRQAGSAMPAAVLEAIDARIAGPALDAQAEQAAQQRGWR
jgi:anti-sigma factor RsiW